MKKSKKGYLLGLALLTLALAVLVAIACQGRGEGETAPAESPTVPEEPVEGERTEVVPAENPTIEGLTYEELRSTTPPAPQNLRAVFSEEGVRLDWEPAPAPGIEHSYSDVIVHYNVYRRVEGELDPLLLATVSETYYVDNTVEEGVIYYYTVSAVHEGPVEGERTEEVSPVGSSAVPEGPVEEERAEEIAPTESPAMSEGPVEGERGKKITPAESSTIEGLTYEELRSMTPPAPQNLRAIFSEEGVRLDWEPAPAAGMEHSYSDVIVHYNVYRRMGGADYSLLATVSQTYYVDNTVEEGVIYYYAVSAVHEGPVEGERTEEIPFPYEP